jgi:hypothetical protein
VVVQYLGQVDHCMERSCLTGRGWDKHLHLRLQWHLASDQRLGIWHLATGRQARGDTQGRQLGSWRHAGLVTGLAETRTRRSHREQVLRASQPSPAVYSCSPHSPLVSPQTLHVCVFGKVRRSPFARSPFQPSSNHMLAITPRLFVSGHRLQLQSAWNFLVPHPLVPGETPAARATDDIPDPETPRCPRPV